MKNWQIAIVCILFVLLIASYVTFLPTDEGGYVNHPLWLGMNKNIIILTIFFQVVAFIGFLFSIGSWIYKSPESGIVKDDLLFYALCLFFLSSIFWPICVKYKYSIFAVLCIILTAIASIWLLIGSITEDIDSNMKTLRITGLLFLCIVTVLCDGVIWNSYYLKNIVK
jgi:hypothetical protein